MTQESKLVFVSDRYLLHQPLGSGGMGIVYRATDRLTGETVALKRVLLTRPLAAFGSRRDASTDLRLILAREFQILASLRHPHIISVLDYGFDAGRQPYLSMTLVENAREFSTAAATLDNRKRIGLLTQLLEALAYLHRRGIVHHDLKPGNVLVDSSDVVKVLDFGLAQEAVAPVSSEVEGTIAYMAPEVLQGQGGSVAADLFAVGVMAYELFTGRHPFMGANTSRLLQNILTAEPDLYLISDSLTGVNLPVIAPDDVVTLKLMPADIETALTEQDSATGDTSAKVSLQPLPAAAGLTLQEIIGKLLAKVPTERYQDAASVIRELSAISGQPAPSESVLIRESFLQAAQFIGRGHELEQLTDALTAALEGQGRAWLVGGESGVGKSRLLDELRIQALVQGALVLRGQAIVESGVPYLLWRDALRYLCLQTNLSDLEAGVLKAIIPDIGSLLQRAVANALEIEPQSAQTRLLTTIEDVFRRQTQPIVVLLEDLQWSNESLTVLKRLSAIVGQLPLLIVGTYRDDERPDLPAELPAMQPMKLRRLDSEAIADLSAAMLGENGRQPQVIDLLQRETEGNVFFIVEVVRALAEEAGELNRIGQITLPQKIFVGGVQTVVQRRLSRVPSGARPLLETAAVAGRELDLEVLQSIAPHTALDSWLSMCADASVLDVQDGRWRFAHDKLREGLLINLSDDQRRVLHRQIAEVMETVFANRLGEFHSIIGEHFLHSEAWEQATDHLILAGDAAARLNASLECRLHYARAIEALSHLSDTEQNRRRRVDATIKQVGVSYMADDPEANLVRLTEVESLLKELPSRDATRDGDRLLLARAHYWRGRTHIVRNEMHEAIGNFQKVLAVALEVGDEQLLAIPASMIGRALAPQGHFSRAGALLAQAMSPLQKLGDWSEWVITSGFMGTCFAYQGNYAAGLAQIQRGLTRAQEINYPIGIIINYLHLSGIYTMGEELTKAVDAARTVAEMAEQFGERVYVYLGNAFQARAESRLGQHDAASAHMAHSKAVAQTLGGHLLLSQWCAAYEAEIAFNAGQIETALTLAEQTAANSHAIGDLFAEGLAQRIWGQALAAVRPPQRDNAEAHLAGSVHILETGGARLQIAHTHMAWGAVCRDHGNYPAAREHFQQAAAQYETSELRTEHTKADHLIEQLHA